MQDMEINEKKTAVWQLHELSDRMVTYNAGDPKRIQHLIKVHYFARMIGLSEGLDAATQLILEATAIVHDIGIRISENFTGKKSFTLSYLYGKYAKFYQSNAF